MKKEIRTEIEEYQTIIDDISESLLDETMNRDVRKVHVAIYVRVSTEEQKKEGFSIHAQIDKLTKYASVKDWIVFDIYNDEGISGKNIEERPALKKMIEDIKNKKVNAVLVFKLDRLTRSIRDLIELTDIFNGNKCEFCSLTENIDTHTATGRMFLKILGIFAEFERENLIERVRSGFEGKASEGYTNVRTIPSFGYNRNIGEKILTVNEEEAKIVQYIFKCFVEEYKSEYRIAKELNAKQIKTKTNKYWKPILVKQVLENVTYIGKIRYAMKDKERYTIYDGKHESIISEEIFEKAQNIINSRKKVVKTKRTKEDAYFRGLLFCGQCGEKLIAHRNYRNGKDGTKKVYIQYTCTNHRFNTCTQSSINHKRIEDSFIEYISNIEDFSETDKIPSNSITEEIIQKNNMIKEKLNNDILKLDTKRKKIMQLFLKEQIDLNEYKTMVALIEKEIVLLENSILDLEEMEQEEEIQVNKSDIILNLKENWLLLNNQQKMEFLQTFVSKIVVESEKEEDLRFNKAKVKKITFNRK